MNFVFLKELTKVFLMILMLPLALMGIGALILMFG